MLHAPVGLTARRREHDRARVSGSRFAMQRKISAFGSQTFSGEALNRPDQISRNRYLGFDTSGADSVLDRGLPIVKLGRWLAPPHSTMDEFSITRPEPTTPAGDGGGQRIPRGEGKERRRSRETPQPPTSEPEENEAGDQDSHQLDELA